MLVLILIRYRVSHKDARRRSDGITSLYQVEAALVRRLRALRGGAAARGYIRPLTGRKKRADALYTRVQAVAVPPGRCWIIRLGCAHVIGAGPAALRALACSAGSGAPCAARLAWQSRQLLPGPRKPPPLPSPLCGYGRGAGAARLPLAPL